MDNFPWIFVVFLVVAVVIIVFGVIGQRRRREANAAWAAARGWAVLENDTALARRWSGAPFGTGSSRKATEILAGPAAGRQALSFRYTYTTTSGSGENKSSTDHVHHVVVVFLPAPLPALTIAPETFGAKIVKAFGGQDIQFESEQFNSRWRVTSPDLRFAHDVVHPRTMERLLRPDVAGRTFGFVGDAVLTWSVGAPQLDVIDARVAVLNEMIDAIPDYVWQDRAHPPR
ncbi:hypothetical protein SAMN05216410_0915 [Sanguibacter gelidistatuariae]|uniref:DUF3137 domain-containing protein n=1 Tax=Sanguibacter gelidistatuariae TaxID=1814289 RepID=A0A1G6HCG8_9MICO|nr:hypothetical protein [Sanguibacter gelidistatuariae]SDB91844.1 hypothetical protein SAMN05216410_0915 [Sanguibacter gelidistatuariae]